MKKLLLFIFISMTFTGICQQKYYTKSRKAIKFYEKALSSFQSYNYSQTAEYLNEAIKADDNFIEAHLLFAQIFAENKMHSKAIEVYDKIIGIDKEYFPLVWLYRANSSMNIGDYDKALESFSVLIQTPKLEKKYGKKVTWRMKNCRFGIKAMAFLSLLILRIWVKVSTLK